MICDRSKLDRRGCVGAPDLIIEILSPATAAKDFKDKFALYEESGVREYWIVIPFEAILQVFKCDAQGKYQLDRIYIRDDTVKVGIFENFSIGLRDIFAEQSEPSWTLHKWT